MHFWPTPSARRRDHAVRLTRRRLGHAEALLELCKAEAAKSSDVKKLALCLDVYGGLLQAAAETRKKVLWQMLALLGHRFPRVRKAAGEKLFLALQTLEDLCGDEQQAAAAALLADTNWLEDVGPLKARRNELCDCFGVPRFKIVAAEAAAAQPVREFGTYKDLVDRAGY